jgi:glutamyl-tRNA reductase
VSVPPAVTIPLQVWGLASSLGSTSLDQLEARSRRITRPLVHQWFSESPTTEEVAVLSTCHRVELVLLVRSDGELRRWRERLPGPPESWQVRGGEELVHHLFRVAAGRESLARGELDVRRQVQTAAQTIESRHPRPILAELFAESIRAAQAVTPPGGPVRSVAAEAARALLAMVEQPHPRVLIVGAGAVGRQVAESLSSTAQVTVLFHRRPPGNEFVHATGASLAPFDQLTRELRTADAVVTAVKSGRPCLSAAQLRDGRSRVLVDLGVPRNIDPDVRALPNVRLIDLEELHRSIGPLPALEEVDERLEVMAHTCAAGLRRALVEPWIDARLRTIERLRQSELASARQFLGDLTPGQEVAIERLTRRLIARLLVPPIQRVRALPPGPEGDRDRQFALALLDPDVDEP